MKKNVIFIVFTILIISSIGLSQGVEQRTATDQTDIQASITEFTHTVLAEYATTTWCPNCPYASEALYELYSTENLPFLYVTLISDVNQNARDRSWYGYFNIVIPSVYFDGGVDFFIGNAGSAHATADVYRDIINEMGSRTDVKDIDIETSVSWNGNAKMTIDVTVENNENSLYLGFLKTYVTEIESRWNDYSGNPYHYGFLDFAINQPILLRPYQTKTITVQWDGAMDHGGLSFEDISQDNIVVQSAVFHWIPHLTKGYDEIPQYTQRYLGFYLDQATIAIPE
jgi:hypothetical protein